jgi:hypothetical protein
MRGKGPPDAAPRQNKGAIMGLPKGSWLALAAAAFVCAPASAQRTPPHAPSQVKAVTLSSLTEQGYEIKAVGRGDALIVQKGKDVFSCTLRLATTSPLSYLSECYSIR